MCKISIIIPVYNGEQFLGHCLDAVLRQTMPDFEVILVDDASTDSTAMILEQYSTDERIHVIRQDENKGVSAARNLAIEKARGRYLTFLDADDYWLDDDMLANLYELAEKYKAEIVDFGFTRSAQGEERRSDQDSSGVSIDMFADKSWNIRYNVWAKLVSASFISEYGIRFDTELIMGEDALFSTALYCEAAHLVTTPAEYYCYRINDDSVNHQPWNERKLNDALSWFERAIQRVMSSDIHQHRPELLQTILRERVGMLYKKLARLSVELLDDITLKHHIDRWAKCLAFLQTDYFSTLENSEQAMLQKRLFDSVITQDYDGFKALLNSDAYLKSNDNPQTVTISRQQGSQLGQDLLQIDKPQIRCDFGNGVVIDLPKDKAHRLARQLIANANPRITLNFN